MKRRSGFTLIEMMIVLAIIAALSAILTPMGMNALNRARATQYVADFRNIRTANEMYAFDNNNQWADSLATLDPNYLDADELTQASNTYDLSVTGDTLTVSATATTGIVDQFIIAWPDGSGNNQSSDENLKVEFSL